MFKVYWDNGASACGVFPYEFDTYEAAEQFGENWVLDMQGSDPVPGDAEGYSFEVLETEGA